MSTLKRLKTGDTVKVISGAHKGKTGKIMSISPKENTAVVEGIGTKTRHIKPSQLNPKGGKKEIHVGIDISKLALVVDSKLGTISRVGYAKNDKGETIRLARQANNREVK